MQNTFIRRWGTGLWEGFKPGLEKITNWLDSNQETVDEWADKLEDLGASFSSSIMGKVEAVQRAVTELTEDPAWQGADFFGKVEIAWDRLIADPFQEWWSTNGKKTVAEISGDFGSFLGSGLKHGILAILGVSDTGILEEGMSAGKNFVDGFLEALDGDQIKAALKDAATGIFQDSFFGGGNSPTTFLSTAAVGMVGLKGLGAGIGLGKGIYGTVTAAKSLGKLFSGSGTAASGSAAGGTAAIGISLPALASVAGGLLTFLGLGSAVKDLRASGSSYLSREKSRLTKTGLTKGGMVLAGAGIGTMIAPGIGTVVGAGAGGALSLLSGNFLSEIFKTERERALESLEGLEDDLADAVESYNETASEIDLAQGLLDEYQELKDGMNSGEFDGTKAEEAQERMKQVLGDLQRMFPDLVSSYEALNGLSDVRISKLDQELERMEKQSGIELEQAKRQLKQSVLDVEVQLPQIKKDYRETDVGLSELQPQWEKTFDYLSGLTDIYYRYQAVDPESAQAREILGEATELSKQYDAPEDLIDFQNHAEALPRMIQELRAENQEISDEMDSLIAKKQEMDDQLGTYYNSAVQLAESDAGIDLEEEQKKLAALQSAYHSLKWTGEVDEGLREAVEEILPEFEEAGSAAEQMELLGKGIAGIKDEVQPVLEKIDELNQRLDMLPEEKKINISWNFSGPSLSEITLSRQGLNPLVESNRTGIAKHAFGGFTSGPELSWIGEDGLEAIIPLSGKYRQRGLELYEQAGRYLGISYHAEGEISGAGQVFPPASGRATQGDATSPGTSPATFSVDLHPQITLQVNPGDSEATVKGAVWQSLLEMMDPLALQIANLILKSRENGPGGGT